MQGAPIAEAACGGRL